MSPKEEFIVELSQALFGKLTQAQINGQIQYYERYIMEEARKGKSEEQVLEELGEPRILAKTIALAYNKPAEQKNLRPFDRRQRAFMLFGGSQDDNQDAPKKKQQKPISEEDQYEPGYRGVKAEFDEEKGWDIRLGKFKINSWYGMGIILGVILIIAGILEKLRG